MGKKIRNEELMGKVAIRMRQVREQKNISQDTMDLDTGLKMSRLESGQSDITISTIGRFCEYAKISVADFFSKGFDN